MSLLDTSMVIKHLQEKTPHTGHISILTLIEILRGIPIEKRVNVKESFEELYRIYHLDNEIINEYCRLYDTLKQEGKLIPETDIIIAATAIAKKITLATLDTHFTRLEKYGLKIET